MKSMSLPCRAWPLVVVPLAVAIGCGAPPPVVPPSPVPTPSPVPIATPSPAAAAAGSCPLGKGSIDAECSKTTPRLLDAVEAAIDALVAKRPELFNIQEEAGAGQYRVRNLDGYVDGLLDELRASGHCAERSLDLERIVLKSSREFSEEWDILTSSGFIRRGRYAYQRTCTPAAFPVEPSDWIAYVRTHLWGYECLPGMNPPTPSEGKIPLGCDGRATATPKQRDGTDVPARIHGPEVEWELREGEEIVTVDKDPRFPDNPFNKILLPSGKIGGFVLCARVLEKEGCLNGQVVP